ncbi:MAG: hypothetical protein KF691_05755 [Phycisphaeraceae bacterium]|nr:hypothetical protein [Phycisphaeraceae bacterium]
MNHLEFAAVSGCLSSLVLGGCQTSAPARPIVQAATAQEKQATLDKVKSLQGTWNHVNNEGESHGQTVFSVGSGGSTVREVMFPGTNHEMTNMYCMDGQALICTHYCAMGNQPRMAADASQAPSNDTLVFKFVSVSNLRSPTEEYMGEMWLTFKDPNTIQQRWKAFKGNDVKSDMVFTLTRVQ